MAAGHLSHPTLRTAWLSGTFLQSWRKDIVNQCLEFVITHVGGLQTEWGQKLDFRPSETFLGSGIVTTPYYSRSGFLSTTLLLKLVVNFSFPLKILNHNVLTADNSVYNNNLFI